MDRPTDRSTDRPTYRPTTRHGNRSSGPKNGHRNLSQCCEMRFGLYLAQLSYDRQLYFNNWRSYDDQTRVNYVI